MLEYLSIDFSEFLAKFIKTVDVGTGYALSLKENEQVDCILWLDGGCSVYEARPVQCRTYPFWQGIVDDAASWEAEAKDCPGIGTGSIRDSEHIQNCLWQRRYHKPLIVPYETPLEELDENEILGGEGFLADSSDT